MYHIRNDKRAAQSAELIYRGLMQCMEKKPFAQITISDIQRASTVACSTFYRASDDPVDVLYWRCDLCFREALCTFVPNGSFCEADLIRHYLSYWMAHSDILTLLTHINRQDIIYTCHMKNARLLEASFGALPGLDARNARYFISLRTGMTLGFLKAWLEGGQKETEEELMQIVETQLRLMHSAFSPDIAPSSQQQN